MYNHTERTYPTAKEGKVLFTRNAGLGIAPKENSPTYSTKLICFIIRIVSVKVVMVATDMCKKNLITGYWIYGIT